MMVQSWSETTDIPTATQKWDLGTGTAGLIFGGSVDNAQLLKILQLNGMVHLGLAVVIINLYKNIQQDLEV
jgi:hypothetical protein